MSVWENHGFLFWLNRLFFFFDLPPQSVFNGMHVIFIPYSLMKVDPASWMKMVTKYKGINLSQALINKD